VIAQLIISPDGSGHDGHMRDVGRGAHMSVEDRTWSSVIAEDSNGAVVGFASAKSP